MCKWKLYQCFGESVLYLDGTNSSVISLKIMYFVREENVEQMKSEAPTGKFSNLKIIKKEYDFK